MLIGASGFLGRYIAREFSHSGWNVVGVDAPRKIINAEACLSSYACLKIPSQEFRSFLLDINPNIMINCAGRASVHHSINNPSLDYYGNTVLVFELLDSLRLYSPSCKFIMLSSAAVYGSTAALPITEDSPTRPISPYGFHKRQAEILCREFSEIYSLQTAIGRIFSAYGPGLRRQVIWDIYEKIVAGSAVQLRGTGAETRDFIHARDTARAISIMANHADFNAGIYNIARGEEVSISELAHTIRECLGTNNPILFNEKEDLGNPSNWKADISKLEALGFTPSISLKQGLSEFIEWCQPGEIPSHS